MFGVSQFPFIGTFICVLVASRYRGKYTMLKEQLKAGVAIKLGNDLCNLRQDEQGGSNLFSPDWLTRNKRQTNKRQT